MDPCLKQPSGPCSGDSGGGLYSQTEDGRWNLIGVVSTGRADCDKTWPTVYADVNAHRKWIDDTMERGIYTIASADI